MVRGVCSFQFPVLLGVACLSYPIRKASCVSLILSCLSSFLFELFLFNCFTCLLLSAFCLHFCLSRLSPVLPFPVSFVSLSCPFAFLSAKRQNLLGQFLICKGLGEEGEWEGEGEGGGRVTSDILNPINPTQQNIFSKSEHFHFLPPVFTVSSAFCKPVCFPASKA